jgi:hypothetical protein
VGGTLYALGGLFGSTDTSGTTQIILGLYSDSGGKPDLNYLYTQDPQSSLEFNNPSGLVRLTSGGGEYANGFNNVLTANTTYWVYLKAGTGGSNNVTAGLSSAACVGQGWINVDAEITWTEPSGPATCAGDYSVYMIVNFP